MWRKDPSYTVGGNEIGVATFSIHQGIFATRIDIELSRQSYPLAITMGNFDYVDQFHGNVVKIEKEV